MDDTETVAPPSRNDGELVLALVSSMVAHPVGGAKPGPRTVGGCSGCARPLKRSASAGEIPCRSIKCFDGIGVSRTGLGESERERFLLEIGSLVVVTPGGHACGDVDGSGYRCSLRALQIGQSPPTG